MEEENNIRTISTNTKQYKSYTEPKLIPNAKLYDSISMTDLNNSTKQLTSAKMKSGNSKKNKNTFRSISEKTFFDHYDKNNCEYCEGIDKLKEQDKSKLSHFIQNNSQFLKLFGNQRYNKSSPYLFVEDQKCGYDDDKIGLIPIPSKPRIIMKSPDEKHKLYEIQRKIVMIRRFQYGKRNSSEPNFLKNQYFFVKGDNIENLNKIVLIQKMFRGHLIRKKVEFIFKFKDIIKKWQKIFDKIKARRILRYLINGKIYILPKANNIKGYNYMSKIRKRKTKQPNILDLYKKSNLIYKNKNHKNENIKKSKEDINNIKIISKDTKPKERVRNNSSSLLTKDYYDIKDSKNKIKKIENNYIKYLTSVKNIQKKGEEDENNLNGLYIDKIYISQNVQKMIKFNGILKHALQKAVFRKKPRENKINELKEEINERIDIKPEYINIESKSDILLKIKNEEPIISNKDFFYKNNNKICYINKILQKDIKDKEKEKDKKNKETEHIIIDISNYNKPEEVKNITKEKPEKKLILSIDNQFNFKYENQYPTKEEKEKANDSIISNLTIPKDKYCYITKEHKLINKDNKEKNEDNKYKKELIVDSKERFNYDSKIHIYDENYYYNIMPITAEKSNIFDKNKLTKNQVESIYYIENNKKKEEEKEEKPKVDKESLLIINNTRFNILKNTEKDDEKNISPKKILVKNNNFSINYKGNKTPIILSIEKNTDFDFEGKRNEPQSDNNIKIISLNIQSTNRFYYEKEEKNDKNYIIEQNKIIYYPKTEKNINNILKIESNNKFTYDRNIDEIDPKKDNYLIKEQINNINFPREYEKIDINMVPHSFKNDEFIIEETKFDLLANIKKEEITKTFNENNIIKCQDISISFGGKEKIEDEKKLDNEDNESINKEMNELYLNQKIIKGICHLTKERKKISSKDSKDINEDDIIFKRKDIFNKDINISGLLISKTRYKKDNFKEKIYKKPLVNEFYSYYIEEDSNIINKNDIKKLKKKPKQNPKKTQLNKKNSKEIKEQKEDEKKIFDDSGLIKKTIPGINSNEVFRIKPNHLLKVIKVTKNKTTYEQNIHVGKIVPEKVKEKDEEFIYIKYKSKTPGKNEEKNIKNNLIKKFKDDQDIEKYLPKWKEEKINLKAKPINEDVEPNDNISNVSSSDSKEILDKKRLIKVYKFNTKNYCYASKLRKIDNEEDKKIKLIQNKYKSLNKDKLKNKKDESDNNDYILKEDYKQNIINNNCYINKEIIKKNVYNKYLDNYYDLYKYKIYQIPLSYKNHNISKNYITKIRQAKAKEKAEEKKLNEKPVNKLSFLTKKRIKKLVEPKLDRTKLKINKCIITKEKKIHCLTLPVQKELSLITKQRKKHEELILPIEKTILKNINKDSFITKERKLILPKAIILPHKNINFIKKERRKSELNIENIKIPVKNNIYIEKIRKKEILEKILLPAKNKAYIEKIRKKDILNDIKTIQNNFRAKRINDNINKNLLFNNKDNNAFIINKYKNNKDNKDFNDENNYLNNCFITKINKRSIIKLYPPQKCYITKQLKYMIKKQPNLSFLSLLDFFIKKNIQEYVFPKLIQNKGNENSKIYDTNYYIDTNKNPIEIQDADSNNYTYPKYYKYLKRIYNFYKTKKRKEEPKAQELYDEIIPDINNSKSLNDLVIKLNDNPDNNNKLIDNDKKSIPKKKIDNNDLIDEIGEFVKFDKNLSNSAFIKNKLKENPNLKNNKNLINMIKNVDDEYNNLINGKYCYKCGKEILKCKCDDINYIFKETENSDDKKEEDDEDLDFDMDDDDEVIKTKQINYFEYDPNQNKGLQMINKPKLGDYISKPEKVLQIYNKKRLDEINTNAFFKDNNFHISKSLMSSNKNLRYSDNSLNNNINDSMNFNNEDNILNSNNKNELSSYTFKNKV